MRILALGAHAADQELSAGMILAKYAREGHDVTILSLTAGEKGHAKLSSDEYREQKIREAHACANILGVQTRILGYLDAELPVSDGVIAEVCDVIRELKPDILITHWENSIHRDHRNAHRIALDARFHAGLRRIERVLPSHWIGRVYYSENWEDMDGYVPDVYVDTTDVFEQYCEALSQFELWNGGTGWPYADYYKSLARMRACVGFGMRATYACTLARPREEKVICTSGLP
ncbi:MAG: PIG-L family deacetylase [Fimbriimonas sp.]|nr:PIG-L family deacetylase [Fimbriimonas sp.]